MEAVQVTQEEQWVLAAMRTNRRLKGVIVALVEVAEHGELSARSARALSKGSEALPESTTAATITIEQRMIALREQDCLYDNPEIWMKLGAGVVPPILEEVVKKAEEDGGRIILRCSSPSRQAAALRASGNRVVFEVTAEEYVSTEYVQNPEWIVVPSHIDEYTLGHPKSEVVTSEMPAPSPQDWFSVVAYARMDGGRQPKGCENVWAYTSQSGTLVGSTDKGPHVLRDDRHDHDSNTAFGAARFGRFRN